MEYSLINTKNKTSNTFATIGGVVAHLEKLGAVIIYDYNSGVINAYIGNDTELYGYIGRKHLKKLEKYLV